MTGETQHNTQKRCDCSVCGRGGSVAQINADVWACDTCNAEYMYPLVSIGHGGVKLMLADDADCDAHAITRDVLIGIGLAVVVVTLVVATALATAWWCGVVAAEALR